MDYRDDAEAAQARIRTLSAELEAEKEARQAAEAARRAAEAARDELKLKLGGQPRPRRSVGMPLLAALCLVGLAVATALYWTRVKQQAREQAAVQARHAAVERALKMNLEAYRRERETLEEKLRAAVLTSESKPKEPIVGKGGTLPQEEIRRVIRAHINEVKSCYEKALVRWPDLAGRVTVAFTIGASGKVVASNVESSTLGRADVESCITRAVRRWRFPRPMGGGIVKVIYPFVLRSTDAAEEEEQLQHGFVSINARPWAKVFLDGKSIGVTPLLRVRVPAGRHLLRLTRPDRKPISRSIVVKAGETEKVIVQFPE